MSAKTAPVPVSLLAFGAFTLLLGGASALLCLPEWHALPEGRPNVEKVREDVAAAGGRLTKPRVRLGDGVPDRSFYDRAFRRLGRGAVSHLVSSGGVVSREIAGFLEVPEAGTGRVEIALSPEGAIRSLAWNPEGFSFDVVPLSDKMIVARDAFVERLEQRMSADRPRTGQESFSRQVNLPVRIHRLEPRPGKPDEVIALTQPQNAALYLERRLEDADGEPATLGDFLRSAIVKHAASLLLGFVVVVAFGVLLVRRRLSFRIALLLAGLAAGSMLLVGLGLDPFGGGALGLLKGVLWRTLTLAYLTGLWAVGESLLRDTVPGFTTSLDALAAGRIGPRAGRSILAGLGLGAALCGVRLLSLSSVAVFATARFHPAHASFAVPLFEGTHNPFFEGAYEAGVFVLLVALVRSFMQRERAEIVAAALFALSAVASVGVAPWLAGYAVALVCAGLLFFAFRNHGFAALLVTGVSAALFREILAAGAFLAESAMPFVLGLSSLGLLAAIGFAGVSRSAREDEGKIEAPDYLKRLESERRVKYEIDLLSEMQLALLPERPPTVRGFEIGVRTVLATEAGGDLYDFAIDEAGELWIAAGDVSGHGYSCGIQQAMVKAALASLVKAGRSPGEVLCEIDRVLRTGRSRRVFTSLALYRVDPLTGRGLFANAGHPFPLLLADGVCKEIPWPGFPLGHGPRRTYGDCPLDLPTGGALVFASDGLFEGPDRFDEPYGYERPRVLLSSVGLWRRPAESMVEALFADWRLHVGDGAPADDTTIVIVRRPTLA